MIEKKCGPKYFGQFSPEVFGVGIFVGTLLEVVSYATIENIDRQEMLQHPEN